jgi:hypothetical protein
MPKYIENATMPNGVFIAIIIAVSVAVLLGLSLYFVKEITTSPNFFNQSSRQKELVVKKESP